MNSFQGKESEEDDQPGGKTLAKFSNMSVTFFFFFCKLESDSFSNVHHAEVFFCHAFFWGRMSTKSILFL